MSKWTRKLRLNFPYISDIFAVMVRSKHLDYNLRTITSWGKEYLTKSLSGTKIKSWIPLIQMQFMGLGLMFEKGKLNHTVVHIIQIHRSAAIFWDWGVQKIMSTTNQVCKSFLSKIEWVSSSFYKTSYTFLWSSSREHRYL